MKNLLINWSLRRNFKGEYIATGEIYNDENKRFADGVIIYTTGIKFIDFENKKLMTRNTEYNLENIID